jgi:hypothetical protein
MFGHCAVMNVNCTVVTSYRNTAARRRKPRRRRGAASPTARLRWLRPAILRHAPFDILVAGIVVLGLALALALNGAYQVARKPTELFFPVSGTLNKTPAETWAAYQAIFRRYSTRVMTPELLAALAQVEGSGNPVARTYWRWSPTGEQRQ